MTKHSLIKVHSADDNAVMVFNANSIMAVEMNSGTTVLYMIDSSEWSCNESPTKIYELASEFGLVKAHSKETNYICLFNANHLQYITRTNDVSAVNLRYNDEEIEISVNETPEKLYNIIDGTDVSLKEKPKKTKSKQLNS